MQKVNRIKLFLLNMEKQEEAVSLIYLFCSNSRLLEVDERYLWTAFEPFIK